MPGAQPDLSNAEVVDFSVESGEGRIRLKLKDGAVLEVKMEIANIFRVGNDPNTGFPTYVVQAQNIIRLAHVPKELRKAPVGKSGSQSPKALQGFS